MTNENDQNLTSSSQQKLTKYSSDLIKKGLGLAKSIQPSDNTPEYWRLQGNDFFRSGNFEEALVCYEQALTLDPLYSLAWNNRGSVMGYLKRYEEALTSFTKAVETDPQNALAWHNMAKVLGSKFENYENAIKCFDKVIEIGEANEEVWWLRGSDLEKLEKYQEAIESYKKAVAINPSCFGAWLLLGNLLNKIEIYEDALFCYESILKIDKVHIEENKVFAQNYKEEVIWMLKGGVLEHLERHEEALASYQEALQFVPNEHEALLCYKVGGQLFELESFQEAIYYFDKALSINSGDSKAWYAKAQILFKFEMYEEAINCYEQSLLYDPEDISAWNNKGYTLEKLGAYKEALDSYQKALEIDPNYELTLANAVRLIGILNEIIESQVKNLTKENWKCIRTSAYFKNRCLQYGFSSQYGVADIELSPNGKFLAAIDTRGHLCIWDLESNQKITEINLTIANQLPNILKYGKHTYIENRFYYSFKKKINHVRESYFENVVNQIAQTDLSKLSSNSKSEIVDLIGEQCYRLAVSSDNEYLFGINGYSIITWKINSGEQVCHIKREYNDISLDRDNKIAIIPFVYGLEIWNLLTGQLEKTLKVNLGNNGYLCFTESLQIDDSGKYVSCNLMIFDKVLSQFPRCISGEYEVGLLLSQEPSFLNFVRSINSKSMNELMIENLNLRQVIVLWDIETGQTVFIKRDQSQLNPGNRASANLDLENQVIIGLFGNQIEVIDIISENISTIAVPYPAVNFEIKVSDGFMFVFDNDKQKFTDGVYVYDLEDKSFKYQLDSSTDVFSNNIIDTETHSILVGCADSSIKIWNYLTGEVKSILSGHNQYVTTISNIADKKFFVSSGDDGIIKIWSY
jgi:tetratricopeptide (TPR) repeat protein